MNKTLLRANRVSDYDITEISIAAERAYYLLKTICEKFENMEEKQKFSLTEIAQDLSGDIGSWIRAREECQNG